MEKEPIRNTKEPLETNYTPSPTKLVRFVNKEGKVTKIIPMNRKQRRKAGIR